jgi:hypothetical protein
MVNMAVQETFDTLVDTARGTVTGFYLTNLLNVDDVVLVFGEVAANGSGIDHLVPRNIVGIENGRQAGNIHGEDGEIRSNYKGADGE